MFISIFLVIVSTINIKTFDKILMVPKTSILNYPRSHIIAYLLHLSRSLLKSTRVIYPTSENRNNMFTMIC